jgi:orotate phosphoribosyltransferase
METARKLASHLLQSKAIIIDPANPFTWASGWRSPIYCDNRKTLSHPEIRRFIRDEFIRVIEDHFGLPDMIAGVATGAIAHAALVAEAMDLPMVYVRSGHKTHGTGNIIEGDPAGGKNVVVIEDLVSTGGSSLKAAAALADAGLEVRGMTAIFTYGFPQAEQNFRDAGITLITLGNYNTLLEEAAAEGLIDEGSMEVLSKWREDPAGWEPEK